MYKMLPLSTSVAIADPESNERNEKEEKLPQGYFNSKTFVKLAVLLLLCIQNAGSYSKCIVCIINSFQDML
jgi:hypothetical protein